MLKALNDRRRLEALAGADEHQKPPGEKNAELAASDQDAIRRAAHYCRFAAAAYGVFGNLGSMKKIVEDEADLPPPDLMMKRCVTEKWVNRKACWSFDALAKDAVRWFLSSLVAREIIVHSRFLPWAGASTIGVSAAAELAIRAPPTSYETKQGFLKPPLWRTALSCERRIAVMFRRIEPSQRLQQLWWNDQSFLEVCHQSFAV